MTSNSKPRVGRARAWRRASALVASTLVATALQATPASAATNSQVLKPVCTLSGGVYNCQRHADAWQNNSEWDWSLGSLGAWHVSDTYYSPNNTRPSRDVVINSSSHVYDRTGAKWQRMRLTQTFKVLNVSGATVSVGWGGVNVGVTDPATVSATQVVLSMTRQAPIENSTMMRQSTLAFPHNLSAHRVEQVSNSTIEYGGYNRTYRLANQTPLTDF